ncbi:MAG: class I SAM-dependent methyltransferase [Clostridia bacterium]|nr:class I SAM-dependent methyltransferase [Clostridia bacterium]
MELSNTEKFTGKANVYTQYRPSYPDALMDFLYTQAGFTPDSVIADVGSGTGKFSLLLLERGSMVYAVEPNEDMRRTAERELKGYSRFNSINASAEATGLQTGRVDFITAAQAFHWFDKQAFQTECQRILKPSGSVVLVWNQRDYQSEIVQKDYEIRKKYAIHTQSLGIDGRLYQDYLAFFKEGVYLEKTFKNDLYLNKAAFIGRNVSASYAPDKDRMPLQYNEFVRELAELYDANAAHGIMVYPHDTQVFLGRV